LPSPRYLIIHGHFYQPPRENPWSGSIDPQPSAAPFPDWNCRINRECYAPNTRARLLDNNGAIAKIINNYEYLSFNVGPTLLQWLKQADPATYQLILAADQRASDRHRGHGSAIAQVYNHIIMPLATSSDKLTQAFWGRAHFLKTFGRQPEGMWLAETAADLESLGILAQLGLKFTILAQNQVDALRPLAQNRQGPWQELTASPDPRQPYRIFWGRGPKDFLDIFLYDGPVSRAVAFENLLRDGGALKGRLEQAFGADRGLPRLVNLATDGESYGHHFHFGDMTLAWLFNALESQPPDLANPIKTTNYGEYLALYPPQMEARLVENSSWSCCHGVERWRADCGCHTGGEPGWNQKWRTPLRDALNWLRDELRNIYETEGGPWLKDPWRARNDYIEVILANFDEKVRADFLDRHLAGSPSAQDRQKVVQLLESQRMGLYMFTSCGWFFDDLAALEPAQNLQYAARAIELAESWARTDLTAGVLSRLRQARPNDPHYPTGEDVWRELVSPARLQPGQAAAHLAAAQILGVPQALSEFILLKQTLRVEVSEVATTDQTRLLIGQGTLEEIRLGQPETWWILALLSAGRVLDILVDDTPGSQNLAQRLWEQGGAAKVKENLADLRPGARHFTPDDLWPSVRQIIMSEQVRDFFDDIKNHARRAFANYRELLRRYRRPDSPGAWMDRFIFRVMAEADLDNFTQIMAEGGAIELTQLKELIERESAEESENTQLIQKAVSNYLLKLLDLLPNSPRPTLMAELVSLTELIKKSLPGADLWASQNRWHLLWNDPKYSQTLSTSELSLFLKVGQALGFGLGVF
jgi:hypothetical protein